METPKEEFYKLFQKHVDCLDKKNRENFSISEERYLQAIAALQLEKGQRHANGHHAKAYGV